MSRILFEFFGAEELLDVGGIASEEAFGTPRFVSALDVEGIASAEAFGTPALSHGELRYRAQLNYLPFQAKRPQPSPFQAGEPLPLPFQAKQPLPLPFHAKEPTPVPFQNA